MATKRGIAPKTVNAFTARTHLGRIIKLASEGALQKALKESARQYGRGEVASLDALRAMYAGTR